MAGMDPMRFLESDDPTERIVMVKIAERWYRERDILDHNLAVHIITELAKGLKK
jgi:hypothetical protein